MGKGTDNSKTIGGFRIEKRIGLGGEAEVYKAVCCETTLKGVAKGQTVALKMMSVDDDDYSQWKRLEKRTTELMRLNHPNIVRYLGCFSDPGENDGDVKYVVVQEFLEGETLKARIQRQPSGLDAEEGLKIVREIVDGLVYTSGCGIVHRDLKPANIFLCYDGNGNIEKAKLIDFEIAKQEGGTTTTMVGNLRGTFDYMAPDFFDIPTFRGDEQSDIFSMGVVMHEALSGETPYQRSSGSNLQANFAFQGRWAAGKSPINVARISEYLLSGARNVLLRALSRDRARRYANFAEFKADLDRISVLELHHGDNSYRLQKYIGKGGFGKVYKARHVQTGEEVAIKRLLKSKPEYLARFKREAKVLRKLAEIDNSRYFVRFVDFFEQPNAAGVAENYLVMQYLSGMPGSSLRDAMRLAHGRGLVYGEVLQAFARYARGLALMHAYREEDGSGIFHRDIKPSNLYYPKGHPERAAIMDFGIVRDLDGTITAFGLVPGTPDYMPPEVVHLVSTNKANDGRNECSERGDAGMDIYALGLCLYEALTGKTGYPRLPTDNEKACYTALVRRAQSGKPPTFDDPLVGKHPELERLLCEMTNPDVGKRLKDASDVATRLELLAKDVPPISKQDPGTILDPDPQKPYVPEGWDEHRKWPVWIALAAGGIALAVGVYVWSRGRKSDESAPVIPAKAEIAVGSVEFNLSEDEVCRFETNVLRQGAGKMLRPVGRYACEFSRTNKEFGVSRYQSQNLSFDISSNSVTVVKPDAWRETPHYKDAVRRKTALTNDFWRLLGELKPVAERQKRLMQAGTKLEEGVRSTPPLIDSLERLGLGAEVVKRQRWVVGAVSNGCSDVVKIVGGDLKTSIEPGGYEVFTITNGAPRPWIAIRDGYEPRQLELFDEQEVPLADSDFTLAKVSIRVPELLDGITCLVGGRVVSGKIEEQPGKTVKCVYRREKFKDVEKLYPVQRGEGQTLPTPHPNEWVRLKLEPVPKPEPAPNPSPVPKPGPAPKPAPEPAPKPEPKPVIGEVRFELVEGVRCLFKGKKVDSPDGRKLAPGRYECVYENEEKNVQGRPRYEIQKKSFEIAANDVTQVHVPYSDSWRKTKDTLNVEQNLRESARASMTNSIWRLLRTLEPVEGRQKRLQDAAKLLNDAGKSNLFDVVLFDLSETMPLSEEIMKRRMWVVGAVSNGCPEVVEVVNGDKRKGIRPGGYEVFAFENGRVPAPWEATRKGYETRQLDFNFDGRMLSLGNDWKIRKAKVFTPNLEPGVTCFVDGKEALKEMDCLPGKTIKYVYRRDSYKDQEGEYKVRLSDSQVLPPPVTWVKDDTARISATNRFWTLVRTYEPVAERRNRLDDAEKVLNEAIKSMVIDFAEGRTLNGELMNRDKWIVGAISNGCPDAVRVGGRQIQSGARELFVFKDGKLPSPWEAVRKGRDPKRLDMDFDGRELTFADSDFVLSRVEVRIPKLQEGIGCRIDGALVTGSVKRRPGETLKYSYERSGHDYVGKTEYKVDDSDGQMLSNPTDADWKIRPVAVSVPKMYGVTCFVDGKEATGTLKYTPGTKVKFTFKRDGYRDVTMPPYEVKTAEYQSLPMPEEDKWILLKVPVRLPKMSVGVVCRVDGTAVSGNEVMLVPGPHACEYSRVDYVQQTIDFQVKDGVQSAVPSPGEWIPSDGLLRLANVETRMKGLEGKINDAAKNKNAEKADWEQISKECVAISDELQAVDVKEASNVRRRNDVDAKVAKFLKQADAKIKKLLEKDKNTKQIKEYLDYVQDYYGDESWKQVVEYFAKAKELGYSLTDDDYSKAKEAYDKTVKRFAEIRKEIEDTKNHGRRLTASGYDMPRLEAEERQLRAWWNIINEGRK